MDTRHIPSEKMGSSEISLPRGRTIIEEQARLAKLNRAIELNLVKGTLMIVAKVESQGKAGPQYITSLKFAYVEDEKGDS